MTSRRRPAGGRAAGEQATAHGRRQARCSVEHQRRWPALLYGLPGSIEMALPAPESMRRLEKLALAAEHHHSMTPRAARARCRTNRLDFQNLQTFFIAPHRRAPGISSVKAARHFQQCYPAGAAQGDWLAGIGLADGAVERTGAGRGGHPVRRAVPGRPACLARRPPDRAAGWSSPWPIAVIAAGLQKPESCAARYRDGDGADLAYQDEHGLARAAAAPALAALFQAMPKAGHARIPAPAWAAGTGRKSWRDFYAGPSVIAVTAQEFVRRRRAGHRSVAAPFAVSKTVADRGGLGAAGVAAPVAAAPAATPTEAHEAG